MGKNKSANKNPKKPETSEEGLPDIADKKNKNLILLIFLGILLAGFMFNLAKHVFSSNKEDIKKIEEEYTIQSNEVKKQQASPIKEEKPSNQLTSEQMALLQARQKELQERLAAPMMIVNNPMNKPNDTVPANGAATGDANTEFMNTVASQKPDTVTATKMGPLKFLIAEGSLIHAVLETAINSDLPGRLRAIVSEPIYSEDGTEVLIPPGSRLIGQYKSGLLQGQSRIFAVWTRLIIPGGISINLGSPSVDNLGIAGMDADTMDKHFWQQFGTAILLSIIGAGASNVGVESSDEYNATQAYRIAVSNSLAQSANQSLKQNAVISPTLTINQGKPIMVFVARDLNFQAVMRKEKANINIF